MPVKGIVGCILSNELVDSFPVHRFQIQQGSAKEIFLTMRNGDLVEELDEPSTTQINDQIGKLGIDLPEGYRGEVNLEIHPWIKEISCVLKKGFVLTIDYGYESNELSSKEIPDGSIQTYYRHANGLNPYQRIGVQDITAHVNFSSIINAGLENGLTPVGLSCQTQFLTNLGINQWVSELRTRNLSQNERNSNGMGMRDLTNPEGLGKFKVLVQEKGVGPSNIKHLLSSDTPFNQKMDSPTSLPAPLLKPEHIQLMSGRYPDATWSWMP